MDTKNQTETKNSAVKTVIGTVVSVGAQKTVHVKVTHMKVHPIYRKALKRTKTFACHNEISEIHVGDKVEIRQTRPVSKTKHFVIVKKV